MTERPPPPEEGLQIEQDLEFQRLEARLQHLTWLGLLVFVLAGLAGLLGSGPLSETTTAAPDGAFWARYHRFARWDAPTPLTVHLGAPRPSPLATVWLRRDFTESHDIDRVTPPPLFVEAHPDRLHYVFYAPDTTSEITFTFTVKASDWGRHTSSLGTPGGPEVPFTQVVLP